MFVAFTICGTFIVTHFRCVFVFAGRSYYFNCEKWFSVDEEDGRIEREITVMDGGLGFYKVSSFDIQHQDLGG